MKVYILYSETIDRYYVGVTQNTTERLRRHNSNHKGFTGKANDWRLMYEEEYSDKSAALRREREIKSWKSCVKIESLIKT